MGRHRRICETCSYSVDTFNSCRNRHCPKCQRLDEVRWLDRQMQDVLPVAYHHVVFTVAHELHAYFRVAPNVLTAFEATQLRTTIIGQGVRINNHYDLGLAYFF